VNVLAKSAAADRSAGVRESALRALRGIIATRPELADAELVTKIEQAPVGLDERHCRHAAQVVEAIHEVIRERRPDLACNIAPAAPTKAFAANVFPPTRAP
jgi:hypothetical protein